MPSYRRGWSWTVSVLLTFGGFFLTDILARLISGWHHPHQTLLALVFLAWLFGCVAWWIWTFAHRGFVPIIRIPASTSRRVSGDEFAGH